MSAGTPNYQKLHEMGKLPKSARGNVPILAQLDAAEKRIKELEAKIAELRLGGDSSDLILDHQNNDKNIEVRCEVDGCEYVGIGRTEGIVRNILRMHGKSHITK